MLNGGFLVDEEKHLGTSHRLEIKKEAFECLYNTLTVSQDNQNEDHHPLVERYDLILLFFSKSAESIRIGEKFGVSRNHLNLRYSFNDFCNVIDKIFADYPELEEYADNFMYHLFLNTYCYYELLMLEDTHQVTVDTKYGPKEMDYITYTKWRIKNFIKNQNSEASIETKDLRRVEMEEEFWFSEGDLDFEEQLNYLEQITERSNQNTYVLRFLRQPIIDMIKELEGGSYTKREIYTDFYELIPFLDPKKALLSEEQIKASDDKYNGNYDEYKYRIAKSFFKSR
ncbi:MAG: hypothetical protein DCO96_03705 [Fluviicola sp. XM-24bin1]|nr:MAG: hypothetical protein DCO96_03705 [Fluviicola sp. XM-24bin1]